MKTIVLYHPDFLVDPEIKKQVEKKGERVCFANSDFFNPRDLEPARLVVLAPNAKGKPLEQADAITAAYKEQGVKVVDLDAFLKGKVEVPAEPTKGFNPDAPLEKAKAAPKAKAAK